MRRCAVRRNRVRGCVARAGADTPRVRRAQDVDGDDIRIEEFDGPLREWLAQAKVERQVKKRFARFLNQFPAGEAAKVYPRRINELCSSACGTPQP